MRCVLAFPPKRPWWKFWIPGRPYLLIEDEEWHLDQEENVIVHRARPGWEYRVAMYLRAEFEPRQRPVR